MTPPFPLLLASTPALRPAFLIVMGAFLLLTVWRMTRGTTGWTPRILLTGAALLAFGYSVVTPLYQAGVLTPLGGIATSGANPDVIIVWHGVRVIAMNAGWLVFGLGLAMHTGLFESARSSAPLQSPQTSPLREPLA